MKVTCSECRYPMGMVLTGLDAAGMFEVDERRAAALLCGDCSRRSYTARNTAYAFLFLAILAVGIAIAAVAPDGHNSWMLLNGALVGVMAVLMIVPHELGHLIAAKLCGMTVHSVEIGCGRTLFTPRILGVPWHFRAVPSGGLVLLESAAPYAPFRHIATVLAGPAVNVLAIVVVVLLRPESLVEGEASGNGLLIGYDLMLANGISLVANLWPRRYSSLRGRIANDGMRVAAIIRSLSDPEEAEKRHWLGVAAREQELGNDAGVRNALEKLMEVDRTDPHTRLGLAGALMMTGEYQWARALFLELLAMRTLTSEDRAAIENQLAFNNLLSGDDALLEEADRCSESALATDLEDPLFKGTRGGVLVMNDRIDEGLPLLEEAFRENVRPQDRAVDLMLMAAAYRRLGRVEEAEECEREAEEMAGGYVLIRAMQIQKLKLKIKKEERQSSSL